MNTEQNSKMKTLRIPDTLNTKLNYIADLERRTSSGLIRKIIIDFVEDYEKEHNLLKNKDYIGSPKYDENLDLNK